MDETQFHQLADATLADYFVRLEPAFDTGALDDLELQGGILTIKTETGKTFILSKHEPSRQLWLASPISGGLHFSYQVDGWALRNGTELPVLLMQELAAEGAIMRP
jgi:iron donor protein CyaY